MPRRGKIAQREVLPDPKFGNVKVAKFINHLMRRGKKSLAESIFYDAIDIIEKQQKTDGLGIFQKAIENVSPVLEVKSRRIGGATYQIPVEVDAKRRFALASRWIILFAKSRQEKSMAEKLSSELLAAANKEGGAIKKREDTHRMAEANKAFAHFR
jgi:small subunit ribosomal protein S7